MESANCLCDDAPEKDGEKHSLFPKYSVWNEIDNFIYALFALCISIFHIGGTESVRTRKATVFHSLQRPPKCKPMANWMRRVIAPMGVVCGAEITI